MLGPVPTVVRRNLLKDDPPILHKFLIPIPNVFHILHAMEMLKAKLYQIAKQQHMDKIDDIKGVQNEIAWGHQIRSYVFMPYTMVKDHRTNYETGNVDAVMDGDLDGFIFAYLKAASRGELQDT